MFAEEKPALLPLPLEPFRYYQYGERSVHLDGCVEVEAAYYSTPPGWIGRQVRVQWDGLWVRILDPHTGQPWVGDVGQDRAHRRWERSARRDWRVRLGGGGRAAMAAGSGQRWKLLLAVGSSRACRPWPDDDRRSHRRTMARRRARGVPCARY